MKKLFFYLFISMLYVCTGCNTTPSSEDEKEEVKSIRSVLILGNSIVAHPPLPEIGWDYDWGMAASARDSDFVHILKRNIQQIDPSIEVSWDNLSVYERTYETYDLNQLSMLPKMDLVILKVSENIEYTEGMNDIFTTSYDRLVNYLKVFAQQVVLVEGFWPTPVNKMIETYATAKEYPFVKLADLFENDKTNAAIGLFENEGVENHPSDKGMRNIAIRIWDCIAPFFNNEQTETNN